jgi:hypothetical protein
MNPDERLDHLFSAARGAAADTSRTEFGFETRLLARLRAERGGSWLAWAWRLCPYFAALALAAGVWGYVRSDGLPDGESLYSTVRHGGLPVLDYYLGGDE